MVRTGIGQVDGVGSSAWSCSSQSLGRMLPSCLGGRIANRAWKRAKYHACAKYLQVELNKEWHSRTSSVEETCRLSSAAGDSRSYRRFRLGAPFFG